jgi:hypothetical protein
MCCDDYCQLREYDAHAEESTPGSPPGNGPSHLHTAGWTTGAVLRWCIVPFAECVDQLPLLPDEGPHGLEPDDSAQ